MKCWNCHKRKKDSYWNPKYCSVCGLWLEKPDLEKAVKEIDGMIQRWDSRKQFNYYQRFEDHICFNFRGIKKIIDHIAFGDQATFNEVEALIQVITYESKEFDNNITSLALHLFCFIVDHFGMYKDVFSYWMKRGLKEKNRTAYDYKLAFLYANEFDKTKRGMRKINKVKEAMRHLPNFVD